MKGGMFMAKMTEKMAKDITRGQYVDQLMSYFHDLGEEILQIKSNEFCFPILDELGNEQFLKVVVSIPNGSKGEPFDGYSEAEGYAMDLAKKADKAAKAKAEKEAKIAKDEARRAKVKEIHNKEL